MEGIFKCGSCRGPQRPAGGADFFICRYCKRINAMPDDAGTAEKYNLIEALKKAAAEKAKEKALRNSTAVNADQLEEACKELELLYSRGYMPEKEFSQITDKAKKRAWVLQFLKENRGLLDFNVIREAAERDGFQMGPFEYDPLDELVQAGLVQKHLRGYCLTGAIEEQWLEQALPYRDGPIDRKGLDILRAMPFEHRGMSAQFRKSMTPGRITAPGQLMYFGYYGGQPILWRTLEVEAERMLLISEFCLDEVIFDFGKKRPAWKSSKLRQWLNSSFLAEAFTPAERRAVLPTENITPHITPGEEECPGDIPSITEHTLDSVWLLSVQEVLRYFPNPDERGPDLTAHAIAKQADSYYNSTVRNHIMHGAGRYRASNWWLRSVTSGRNCAYLVACSARRGRKPTGKPSFVKLAAKLGEGQGMRPLSGLRPAMWVDRAAAAAACSCLPEADALPRIPDVSEISEPGQRLNFGTYAGSPIAWRVLECKDGTALLISENGLQIKYYHKSRNGWTADYPTWEGSDLRAWLNGEFFQSAFSGREQERLCRTTLTTPDNSFWTHGDERLDKVEGGGPTEDLVWIPSIREVEHYFSSPEDRTAGITAADKYNFAACWETDWKCFWWLRDPGKYDACAACVMPNGEFFYADADYEALARPMIRIRLPENQK